MTSCLEGITRASIIEFAGEIDIPIIEKRITRDEVYCADEAFFTGTAVEVMPINAIDKKSIADGLRGPITEKLQKAYLDQVRGKRSGNKDWQSPIDS